MTDTAIAAPERTAPVGAVSARTPRGWLRNPWRKPRFLESFTWLYLAWSILPVLIAIAFSFNAGRSRSAWQGFSLRWWTEDPTDAFFNDAALRGALFQSMRLAVFTVLIAVPIGTLFAIGLDRWRGRVANTANFTILLGFVVPEIILGFALFLTITEVFTFITRGTYAQVVGLVTWQIAYSVIIVRARLLSIGSEYEEAAMDLGASPTQAIRRVLMPLLYPAIFASAAIVFADSIDDFVTVRFLSGDSGSEPLSVKIYNAARGSPTPAVNAAATMMLVVALLGVGIGILAYRFATRGQRKEGATKEFVNISI
ncbi:MAG: ABC transporter permease [Actinomycetota bacterium]